MSKLQWVIEAVEVSCWRIAVLKPILRSPASQMGSPTTEISKNCAVQKIHAKISTCLTACYFGISVITVLSALHPDCPQKSVEYLTKPGAIWHDSKYCHLNKRVNEGLDKSSAWGELPLLYTKIQTFPISFARKSCKSVPYFCVPI